MPVASVTLPNQTSPSGAPAAKPERRRKGRAKVSREMRVRAAEFNDGSFEEVCSTLNFSRCGLYFLTPHDRYRVGMRLRVSPANQQASECAWEHLGKVVRVHRQGALFGVAVFLSDQAPSSNAIEAERRSAARPLFVASTEIIDVHTGERSRVRTADLSTRGCYIDTLNPLPLHSTVRLQIEKENETVQFQAKVVSSHLGSGMGLVFEPMTAQQRNTLAKWLGCEPADSPAGPSPDASPRCQETAQSQRQSPEDPRFLKLVSMLTSKGILSDSEADSLLRDLSETLSK
jgi:hypothetical protein